MCNPIIGAIVSGFGQMMQMRQAAANAEMQAEAIEQQREQERIAGIFKGKQVETEAHRIGGQQRAVAAESGVAPQSGSFVDIQGQTASDADLDIQAIRFNSKAVQNNLNMEAQIQRANAKSYKSAAPFAFLSPVLKTATKMDEGFGF